MKIVFKRFAKAIFLGLSLSCFVGLASAAGGMLTTFGTRGTVTPTAPMYGGFTIVNSSVLYIAVRGPSLKTLGITQKPLDSPNLRVYDVSGNDLLSSASGGVIVAGCPSTGSSLSVTVSNYYTNVRGQSLDERDTCVYASLAAGVYTFTINPNTSSSSGEILFEVTVNPEPPAATNRTNSLKLVGGTWTLTYTIGTLTFTDMESFTSVRSTPDSSENYYADGTDQYGDPVVGTYYSQFSYWDILDPSIILDKFFTFTFVDDNNISGCYYQIYPKGSSNLSNCYPMYGVRGLTQFSSLYPEPNAEKSSAKDVELIREVMRDNRPVFTEPGAVESYLNLRNHIQ